MRTHGRKFSKNILGQRLNIDRFDYQINYKLNKKLKWYTLTETAITTTAVTKACIIKNVTSLLAVTFNNNYPSNFWWYCVQSMYINDDRDCQGGGGGAGMVTSGRRRGPVGWLWISQFNPNKFRLYLCDQYVLASYKDWNINRNHWFLRLPEVTSEGIYTASRHGGNSLNSTACNWEILIWSGASLLCVCNHWSSYTVGTRGTKAPEAGPAPPTGQFLWIINEHNH